MIQRATNGWRVLAVVTATALVAAMPGWTRPEQSTAAPTTVATEPGPTGVRSASRTVTLITGDIVNVSTQLNGHRSFGVVRTAARSAGEVVSFSGSEREHGFYIIPSDAEPYVASGALDEELFNTTALPATGLPLIITYTNEPSARAQRSMPGGTGLRQLPSIDGLAVRVDPAQANRFWDSIETDTPAARTFQRGVEKIWLDRPVRATLAESVPQIGAPHAWQAGYDGTGVKVAVLDTGVDQEHPDLTGKVSAARNFTDSPTAEDRMGHGTHVASTIAGSGAASGGANRGVAPGASILNAKVLGDNGSGSTAGVIAGLEWAAQQGADVINMSLSLDQPADGTDPLGQAVNQVTAETGTLVVAAAGNRYQAHTVYSPAAATEALAVGAVDKAGRMAAFSSRGPGLTTAAVKPEITAPGVSIVAARARDTNLGQPVGEHYSRLDGTSMATPHVAGAVALIAQANPAWQARELKEAMVSTAASGGHRWFEEGAGRVDVVRALDQKVYSTSTINFGAFPYPHEGTTPSTRQITYRNATANPVTLDLDVSVNGWTGSPAPAGAVRLGTDSVTVPAGASATVDVTVDPAVGPTGVYGGVVSAASADGSVRLRTPVSWYKEPRMGDLSVRVIDARGRPVDGGLLRVIRADDPDPNHAFAERYSLVPIDGGVARARLAEGVYSVHEMVLDVDLGLRRLSVVVDGEVRVPQEREVTLDARHAIALRPSADEHLQQSGTILGVSRRSLPSGELRDEVTGLSSGNIEVHSTAAGDVSSGSFSQFDRWTLESSMLDVRVVGHPSLQLRPDYDPFSAAPRLAGLDGRLPLVYAGQGRAEDFARKDVSGKLALVRLQVPPDEDDRARFVEAHRLAGVAAANAAAAGARAVFTYADVAGSLPLLNLPGDPIAQLALSNAEGEALRRLAERDGRLSLQVDGRGSPEKVFRLNYEHPGGIDRSYRQRIDTRRLARVDSRYHSDKPGLVYTEEWNAFSANHPVSAVWNRYVRAPATWTAYTGELGDELTWSRRVSQSTGPFDPSPTQLTGIAVYPKGQRPSTERWFESPVQMGAAEFTSGGPIVWEYCTVCRQGDFFVPPEFEVDAAQRHHSHLWGGRPDSTVRLFRDDVEIPADRSRGYVRFPMAAEPGRYRLDLQTTQRAVPEIRTLGTTVTSSWTFGSRRPEPGQRPDGYLCRVNLSDPTCAFQPLLLLRYDLGLDLLNRATAGRTFEFEVTAAAHQGTPGRQEASGMTASTSTDDGRTWRSASVRSTGDGTFKVRTIHPRLEQTNGFVTLRVGAWDRDGNRVSQTINRAYALAN